MEKSLSTNEINEALLTYPPILTLTEAAAILRLQPSTLYRHISEGRYKRAVKRGKPLRFWRDRLIKEYMQ